MLVGSIPFATRPWDRGCSAHPVFPAPSIFRGPTKCKTSGAMRREGEIVSIDRHLRNKRTCAYSEGARYCARLEGRRPPAVQHPSRLAPLAPQDDGERACFAPTKRLVKRDRHRYERPSPSSTSSTSSIVISTGLSPRI